MKTLWKALEQQKLEGGLDELESNTGLPRQSGTKYLRLTPVFMWKSALREKFNFYFSGDFCYR